MNIAKVRELTGELQEHVLRVHPFDAALGNRVNALVEELAEDDDVDSTVDRGGAAARKGKPDSGNK